MTHMSELGERPKGKVFIKYIANMMLTLSSKCDLSSNNHPKNHWGNKTLSFVGLFMVVIVWFCFLCCFMFLFFHLGSKNIC